MITFVFGPVESQTVQIRDSHRAAGTFQCRSAKVRWYLSLDRSDLPPGLKAGQSTFRSIQVDGQEIEFSDGFTDLHTASYQDILSGKGFGIEDVRPSIEIASTLRSLPITPSKDAHPLVSRVSA